MEAILELGNDGNDPVVASKRERKHHQQKEKRVYVVG